MPQRTEHVTRSGGGAGGGGSRAKNKKAGDPHLVVGTSESMVHPSILFYLLSTLPVLSIGLYPHLG